MEKEVLILQLQQWKSVRQIAVDQHTSFTNVRYWLKKYGLRTKRGPHGKLSVDFDPSLKPHSCIYCKESDPTKFYGNKRKVCGKCHNGYCITKGQEKKARVIAHLGGSCSVCRFDVFITALDIHHLDSNKKDPNFSGWRGWSWERIERELEGCVLLCRNCHAGVHGGRLIIRV
jgi:hypothetical protein